MAPRILILSASVGGGHLRAAQAVELALRQLSPDAVIQNLDVLDLSNRAFRRVYARGYLGMADKASLLLRYFYDRFDRPSGGLRIGQRLRLQLETWNLRRLLGLLAEDRWDCIVHTHFLPAEIVAWLRRRGDLDTPHMTVTTDFETHCIWINHPCERYCTATPEGAAYLQHWGVPAPETSVTGIPIHPAFAEAKNRTECLQRQGLAGDIPIVLQLAGGFGVGPVTEVVESILKVKIPLQLVVVTGRNEKLADQLRRADLPASHRVKVLGFTDQIDELMAAADVVVSKPGGLTTSEVLARGAVMAIMNPIAGQEERNSDYLLEHGAAVKINHPSLLPAKLTRLLRDPQQLQAIKQQARRIAQPQAAFKVARLALSLAGNPVPSNPESGRMWGSAWPQPENPYQELAQTPSTAGC
jgi:processive 1,2-diacylglycerol beta-glucosyltransferase